MISRDDAVNTVKDLLKSQSINLKADDELIVLDDSVIEKKWGWIISYTSKMYNETKDVNYAIAGNAPYFVEKETGKIIISGTAKPLDFYIDNYEKTGDPHKTPLNKVEILGANDGADKISAIKSIHKNTEMKLAESQKVVADALNNIAHTIEAKGNEEAEFLIKELSEYKFIVKRKYKE